MNLPTLRPKPIFINKCQLFVESSWLPPVLCCRPQIIFQPLQFNPRNCWLQWMKQRLWALKITQCYCWRLVLQNIGVCRQAAPRILVIWELKEQGLVRELVSGYLAMWPVQQNWFCQSFSWMILDQASSWILAFAQWPSHWIQRIRSRSTLLTAFLSCCYVPLINCSGITEVQECCDHNCSVYWDFLLICRYPCCQVLPVLISRRLNMCSWSGFESPHPWWFLEELPSYGKYSTCSESLLQYIRQVEYLADHVWVDMWV